MTGIAFNHLDGRFKTSIGDFSHRELIMVSLLSRNDWNIGDNGEMDFWVGYQVGLELGQIDIEGTIE